MKINKYLLWLPIPFLLAMFFGCSSREDPPVRRKVILLGADGLTEKVVARLLQQKKLKNIQYLRNNGSYGRMASIEIIVSPAIWTSVATGKKREDHGIILFQTKDKDGRLMIVNNSHRRTKALWNILSENQMNVGSVGYFTTWPVEAINGFMVSDVSIFPIKKGYYPPQTAKIMKDILDPYIDYDMKRLDTFARMSFEEQFEYFTPKMFQYLDQLGSELIDDYLKFKNRRIYSKIESEQYRDFFKNNGRIANIMWAYFVDHIRFEYARRLYRKDLDFFTLLLKGPDVASHFTWEYYEPGPGTPPADMEIYQNIIPNYYSFIDRVLGFFLKAADLDTVVLLVSDHGFERVGENTVVCYDINKILNTMGYLDYGPDGQIKTDKIFDEITDEWMLRNRIRRLHVNLNNIYPNRDPGRDEEKIRRIIDQLAAIRVGEKRLFREVNYFPAKHSGRYSAVLVQAYKVVKKMDSYQPDHPGFYTIEAVINKDFDTPEFHRKHPYWKGIITINQRSYPLDRYFRYSVNKGKHSTYDGVVNFIGPVIKSNNLVKGFSILDVTPAILKILDLPIGADMAGGVPIGIFKPEFLVKHPTRYIKSYDEINKPLPRTTPQRSPVDHKIKKQYRSLGYIQ